MGFIISAVIAYLLGSISCSILLAKFCKLPDPRTQGSGNAGATNMIRIGGMKIAAGVLAGDLLKGFVAVLIGRLFHLQGFPLALIGLAAVIGHIYPIYFKFRGGKGAATGFGAVLCLAFWVAIFMLITWAAVLLISRYVSLASMVTAAATPIYLLIAADYPYVFPIAIMAALIIWAHRSNIEKLRAGTEDKFTFDKGK